MKGPQLRRCHDEHPQAFLRALFFFVRTTRVPQRFKDPSQHAGDDGKGEMGASAMTSCVVLVWIRMLVAT